VDHRVAIRVLAHLERPTVQDGSSGRTPQRLNTIALRHPRGRVCAGTVPRPPVRCRPPSSGTPSPLPAPAPGRRPLPGVDPSGSGEAPRAHIGGPPSGGVSRGGGRVGRPGPPPGAPRVHPGTTPDRGAPESASHHRRLPLRPGGVAAHALSGGEREDQGAGAPPGGRGDGRRWSPPVRTLLQLQTRATDPPAGTPPIPGRMAAPGSARPPAPGPPGRWPALPGDSCVPGEICCPVGPLPDLFPALAPPPVNGAPVAGVGGYRAPVPGGPWAVGAPVATGRYPTPPEHPPERRPG